MLNWVVVEDVFKQKEKIMFVDNTLCQFILEKIKENYGYDSLEYDLFKYMTVDKFKSIIKIRYDLLNDLIDLKEIIEDSLLSEMKRTNRVFEGILNMLNETIDNDLDYNNFFNVDYQSKIDKAIHTANLIKTSFDIAIAVTEDIHELYNLD